MRPILLSTQLNLMPFPYKIVVQEMNYLHANSVVKNTTSLLTKYVSVLAVNEKMGPLNWRVRCITRQFWQVRC